mmetsp:Transcript_19357/g.42011  ORF Transcript_19357/g.42011 Transcript_19357/m.42011 type:complete len:220 (-) Transcript_19357:3129-3788(-)
MHKHLALICHKTNQRTLLMWARPTVGRTTPMLLPFALLHARVVQALNVLISVLSIHALATHHAMTGIRTSVAQLGAMRHLIAYFLARAVVTVNAPTKRSVSHIPRATKLILSCVEEALMTPLLVIALVRQEVVANVLLVSHALHTQHVDQRHKHKSLQLHQPPILTSQETPSAVYLFLMRHLSAQSHVQQDWIQHVRMASNASLTPPVPTEKRISVVKA